MKYIVYLTTNTINKKIYVGVHQTENPDIFDGYLGCGVVINQPSTYKFSKTVFQAAVNKYGVKAFIRKTIQVFDNEEDAYYLESIIVNEEFLKRKDVYNTALGGNGGDRGVNAKAVYQYSLEGEYMNEYKSIADASRAVDRYYTTLSIAIMTKHPCAKYLWTTEKFKSVNPKDFIIDQHKIPVYQYDKDGNYEKFYQSITDAAKELNSATGNVIRAIKAGYLINNKYVSYELEGNYSRAKCKQLRNTPVYQYSLSGEYLNEYSSFAEAERALGKKGISSAIKLNRTWQGYQWSIEKIPAMPNKESSKYLHTGRMVGRYSLDGELLETFKTVGECSKQYPGCRRVLKGRGKTCKGYLFKYLN